MSVPGPAQGIQISFLATMNARALAARHDKAAAPAQATAAAKPATDPKTAQAAEPSSFLDDVLDVINPLQHLPLVSTAYRAITGDKIGDVERVAGDTLYGGLMGLGSALANIAFREATGKDFGDTALALLGLDGDSAKPTAVAAAKPAATPTAVAAAKPAAAPAAQAMRALAAANNKIIDLTPGQSAALSAQLAALKPAGPLVPQAQAAPPAQTPASVDHREPSPASVVPAQATNMLTDPKAFMAGLKARGIDPALAMRAMASYEKTLGLGAKAPAPQP